MRYMLAKRIFKKCGEKVRIFHEVEFSFGYNLSVGSGVTIHRNVLIDDRGEVVIGDEASISDYVNILARARGRGHPRHQAAQDGDRGAGRVTYHAVVLSGVWPRRNRRLDGRLEAGRAGLDHRRHPHSRSRRIVK